VELGSSEDGHMLASNAEIVFEDAATGRPFASTSASLDDLGE
jgi:hypothetical protein